MRYYESPTSEAEIDLINIVLDLLKITVDETKNVEFSKKFVVKALKKCIDAIESSPKNAFPKSAYGVRK